MSLAVSGTSVVSRSFSIDSLLVDMSWFPVSVRLLYLPASVAKPLLLNLRDEERERARIQEEHR
jgi:hypothetical protein